MRVATRRLRAFLRAARPLLDLEWAESLREELAWLGSALAQVRDLDVLIEHLRDDAAGLEAREQRALRRLFALLDEERERERLAMLDALGSKRYLLLLDRLERDVEAPRFVDSEIGIADMKSMATNNRPEPRKTVAKQLVLLGAQSGPDHADEPQEGDARERDELHRRGDRVPPAVVADPRRVVPQPAWDGRVDQHDHGRQGDGEDDAGHRGGARGPQFRVQSDRTRSHCSSPAHGRSSTPYLSAIATTCAAASR